MRQPIQSHSAHARRAPGRAAILAALVALLAAPAWGAEIMKIRVGNHPTFTRLVFELDQPAGYRIERNVDSPHPQLVITLNAGSHPRSFRSRSVGIASVQVRPEDGASVARVSLRHRGARLKEMILTNPPRIVLDVMREEPVVANKKPSAHAPKVVAKKKTPAHAPKVVAEKKTPAHAPKVVAEKKTPAPAPKPVAEKKTPAPAPKVVAKKKTPAPAPKPVAEKKTPAPAPKVVAEKKTPAPAPKVVAEKKTPAPAPKPVTAAKQTPTPAPRLVAKKTTLAPAPRLVAKKTTLAPAPNVVAKKPPTAPAPEVVAEKTTPAPAPKEMAEEKAPAPAPKAEPVQPVPGPMVAEQTPTPMTRPPAEEMPPAPMTRPPAEEMPPAPMTRPPAEEMPPAPMALPPAEEMPPAPMTRPPAEEMPPTPAAAQQTQAGEGMPAPQHAGPPPSEPMPPAPETAKPAPELAKVTPPARTDGGLSWLSRPMLLGGAAGVLVCLIGLVWLIRRRRPLPSDLDVTTIAEPGLDPDRPLSSLFDDQTAETPGAATAPAEHAEATAPARRTGPSKAATAPAARYGPTRKATASPRGSTNPQLDDLFGDAEAAPEPRGDATMNEAMSDLPADPGRTTAASAAPSMGGGPGPDKDVIRVVHELERRMAQLESKLAESNEARERLERQVAAQSEELRVQRAAIARTQRALRTMSRGEGEDKATEPAMRNVDTQTRMRASE